MAHHIHAEFEDSRLRLGSKSWFQRQSHSVDFSMGLAYPSWGFKKKWFWTIKGATISKTRTGRPLSTADIVTLTLAELILWPMELTVLERATCTAFATYDQSHKVETWKVTQKDGVQGC